MTYLMNEKKKKTEKKTHLYEKIKQKKISNKIIKILRRKEAKIKIKRRQKKLWKKHFVISDIRYI